MGRGQEKEPERSGSADARDGEHVSFFHVFFSKRITVTFLSQFVRNCTEKCVVRIDAATTILPVRTRFLTSLTRRKVKRQNLRRAKKHSRKERIRCFLGKPYKISVRGLNPLNQWH